ncbi:hypothetical protein [Agrococcus sp. Ld7]|uniref:hypothetical protein n=1 Tax=Agrococcus sp. Ld7 TaxID=649148 RepID=UPI0038682B11
MLDEAFDVAAQFVALVDAGFAARELPTERMQALASDEAIAEVRTDLEAFQQQGLTLEGESTLDTPMLGARVPADESRGTVRMLVCIDTSGVTTTDQAGLEIDGGVTRQPRVFVFTYDSDRLIIADIGPPETDPELPGCGS